MLEVGMIAEFALGLATLLWYGRAAGRFSERVVGYNVADRPSSIRSWLREGPAPAGRQVLAAWRIPSSDPETERRRILMRRRFAVFVVVVASSFVLPAIFALVGLDWQVLSRGGVAGLVPLVILVAFFAMSGFEVAQPLVAYGYGSALDLRRVIVALGQLVVAAAVAIAIYLLGSA